MSSKQLEYLRTKALKKFEVINEWFSKMRKAFERDGYQAQEYIQAQEAILNELMGVRFTAKMVAKLADTLRAQVAEVRKLERTVLHACVYRAVMPRATIIKAITGNHTNTNW